MSFTHPLIITVLVETNHFNIQELGRLRAISRNHKAIIDRYWPIIVRKFLNSIGTSDINYAANLVFRNDDLLLQVLAERQLRTGFVLNNDGKNLLLSMVNQDSKARQMLINELGTDDKLFVLQAASKGDVNTYKRMYYAKQTKMRMAIMATNDVSMQLIFRYYFRELLLSNTKDYQINWNNVNEWDKTQFYTFIKPGLYAYDMVVLMDAFYFLSHETRTREKPNIIAFIKRNMQPYIDYEKELLQKVLTHSLTEMPRMYGNTTHKSQMEKRIITESLIRRLVTAAAAVDANLAIEYFLLAHELFDLTDDVALHDLAEVIVRSKTYEIIPVYTKWYKFPVNLYSLLLALSNKIDVSNINFQSENANVMEDVIRTKIGLLQGTDPDELDQMYGQLYQLESHDSMSLYAQIATTSLDLSLLMSTKSCMELYAKLPAGGRSYDLFINRDLDFWKYYIQEVMELSYDGDIFQPAQTGTDYHNQDLDSATLPDLGATLPDAYPPDFDAYPEEMICAHGIEQQFRGRRANNKSNPLLRLLQYHIALYSIDVVRYILYLLPLNDLTLLGGANKKDPTWFNQLIYEVSLARGMHPVRYSKEILQNDFWADE